MYPYVSFLGFKFPTYSLCAMLGILSATVNTVITLYSKRLVRKYTALVYAALPGVVVGGKLFSIISITLTQLYTGESLNLIENAKHSGSVYYGGLFGYLSLLYLLCKLRSRSFTELENLIVSSIPLFHSFGRVGCFFAGCCYGIESHSWFAIPYRTHKEAEIIKRIPVQLFEASFELCLYILLCVLFWRAEKFKVRNHSFIKTYLIMYAPFRFVIEFLRGDMIRGVYWNLSFSQIISLILIYWILYCHLKNIKKKKRKRNKGELHYG